MNLRQNLNYLLPAVILILIFSFTFGYFIQKDLAKNQPPKITTPTPQYNLEKEQIARPIEVKIAQPISLPIIMYHYIEPIKPDMSDLRKKLTIQPAELERQLQEFNKEGYTGYFVKDVPDLITKFPTTTKPVILTFDDGYRDFYTSAWPILKKYNFKATIYIISNAIGLPNYITQDQLLELAQSPLIEIGSHTLDHKYLAKVDLLEADRQIGESKKELQQKLKINIQTFAYPYGSLNSQVIEIVKKAGYTAALSTMLGGLQGQENLFFLSRIRGGLLTNSPSTFTKIFQQIDRTSK